MGVIKTSWTVCFRAFHLLTRARVVSSSGPVTAPSWQCPPQTATAPSCPSLLGSWAPPWRSPPPWRCLSRAAALRKRARGPRRLGLHLLWHRVQPWLPRPTPAWAKMSPPSPPRRRRRAPRVPSLNLSLAGSPSTPWRAGGSPAPRRPPLLRHLRLQHPRAPAHPPPPNPVSPPSRRPAPRHSHASPPSRPPPRKPSTVRILPAPPHPRVQPPERGPPRGNAKVFLFDSEWEKRN